MKVYRSIFLQVRREATAQAKLAHPNAVVVDAGDEINCDVCNAEIVGTWVDLHEEMAYCTACWERNLWQ